MANLAPGPYRVFSGIDNRPVNTCPPHAPADIVILEEGTIVGLAAREYMIYAEILMVTG